MRTNNSKPRMTVNKLGEFLTASPKKQRSILTALKYPGENKFRFTGYNEARRAIKNYLLNGCDNQILLDCIIALEAKDEDEKDNFTDSSIEALTKVLESDKLDVEGFTYLPYEGDNPKLNIRGVEVSVYPDFIFHSESRGNEFTGAGKIHLSKDGYFGEEGGKYITTMIYSFVENHVDLADRSIKHSNCISYDVFTDSIADCPRSIARRWQNIEAGCENITAIWDSI